MTTGSDIQVDAGNFTRIHNTILERLAKADLNGSQFRCLMFLFRQTYGYKKKEDTLSFSRWTDGTGIGRRQLIRTLQSLEDAGYIYATDNGNNRPKTYGFNKYHWDNETGDNLTTSLIETGGENDTTSSDNLTTSFGPSSDNLTTKTSDNLTTHKRKKEIDSSLSPSSPKLTVPHKPRFNSNGTSSRPSKPAIQTDSPHIDPAKFRGGYIPAGMGRTPVEVFYERYSIRETSLSAPLEDDICGVVKDLNVWRGVVADWQKQGYKPTNITGQLEWYHKRMDGQPAVMAGSRVDIAVGDL